MKKILLALLLLAGTLGLSGCSEDIEEVIDDEVVFDIPEEVFLNPQDLPYAEYLSLTNPLVTIVVRDMGEIEIQLFPALAPNTVNNFINYIQSGVYENNEFHRVIQEFMIQGGKIEDPSCTIAGEMTNNGYENLLLHDKGVISMARVDGDYDSQSSQFFIMHKVSSFLDSEYTGFGGVVTGFNILEFIGYLNIEGTELPSVPVYIDSITVELYGILYPAPVCID